MSCVRQRVTSAINLFVMPFAQQRGQNELTSVLTDRCNFNLTWKAEADMKGGQKSDPHAPPPPPSWWMRLKMTMKMSTVWRGANSSASSIFFSSSIVRLKRMIPGPSQQCCDALWKMKTAIREWASRGTRLRLRQTETRQVSKLSKMRSDKIRKAHNQTAGKISEQYSTSPFQVKL